MVLMLGLGQGVSWVGQGEKLGNTKCPHKEVQSCLCVHVCKWHNISNSSAINILIPRNYTGSDIPLRWDPSTLPDNYAYQTNWEGANKAEMKAKK